MSNEEENRFENLIRTSVSARDDSAYTAFAVATFTSLQKPLCISMTSAIGTVSQTPAIEEQLCSQCIKLNLRRYLAPMTLRLYWDLPMRINFDHVLPVSISSSCALCRLLAQSIKPGSQNSHPSIKGVEFEELGDTQTLEGIPTASLCMKSDASNAIPLTLHGGDAFRIGARRCSYARLVQPDRANRELIKSWLQQCEQQHNECSITRVESESQFAIPDYVIDVDEMKLVSINEGSVRYLALSYVWGKVPSLQLQKHNLGQLTKVNALRESFSELSSVVRDAIILTREIGERYLWVDTLCICQDDSGSKEMQIANMNIVYAQAAMTLVALEGSDASYGLPGVQPYPMPRHQPLERVHQLRMLTVLPEISVLEKDSVWRSRAWTYQEEQFSRRILFFTKYQVYFRCQRSTWCEDRFENHVDLLTIKKEGLLSKAQTLRSYQMWEQLVTNYSTRSFGFDADRYNAFAGIENELNYHWNLPCLLGIPVRHLVQGLYWHLDLTHRIHEGWTDHRVSDYPSWSWCGWRGGVVLPPLQIRFNITKVQISGDDTVFKFEDDGKLLPSSTIPPPTLSQSNKIIGVTSKQPILLSFSAYSSRLRLNTSRFAKDGILFIEHKHGKTCGVIYGAYLSPHFVSANENKLYECMLIGSCSRPDTFDKCKYPEPVSNDFMSWAAPPADQEPLEPQNISEVHKRASIYSRILQLSAGPSLQLNAEPNWSSKLLEKYPLLLRLYSLVLRFFKIIRFCFLYAIGFVAGVAIVVSLIASLIAIVGLALGLIIPICILVTALMILLFSSCWIYQTIFNAINTRRKCYAWDSIRRTQLGSLVDKHVLGKLPIRYQRFIFKYWSKPIDDIEMEQSKGPSDHNIVNIMLIENFPERGIDFCERLAVGEMSANCWWDSQPTLRQVVLQ